MTVSRKNFKEHDGDGKYGLVTVTNFLIL